MLVLGASCALGLALVRELAPRPGVTVTGASRTPAAVQLLAAGASAALCADASQPAELHAAFAAARPTVVVQLAGSSPGVSCGGRSDALFAVNAVDCALACPSVRQFILLSALGTAESLECVPAASHDVLRPFLEAKEASEDYARTASAAGGLACLILRSGPLTDDPADMSRLVLSENASASKAFSTVPRRALARVLADAACSRGGVGGGDARTLCVIDSERVIVASPSMRSLEPWESPPFDAVALL